MKLKVGDKVRKKIGPHGDLKRFFVGHSGTGVVSQIVGNSVWVEFSDIVGWGIYDRDHLIKLADPNDLLKDLL